MEGSCHTILPSVPVPQARGSCLLTVSFNSMARAYSVPALCPMASRVRAPPTGILGPRSLCF